MKQIVDEISQLVKTLYGQEIEIKLERPRPEFGDFATNIAMQLAGKLSRSPREIALEITEALNSSGKFKSVEVAGPGFINLFVQDNELLEAWKINPDRPYEDQIVVVEYSDPNPFKVLHAGHFYTSVVGDAIANLVEKAGGKVHRANFGGDVGLHVAKTMWSIIKDFGGEFPEKLEEIEKTERVDWIAKHYVEGTLAYETDENAKAEIVGLNKRVYELHNQNDHESNFAKIYWQCREWSYEYFDQFYERIGSGFEKYYPESATAKRGLEEVSKRIGSVFEKSDGAVIFRGEKFGLHTRVFINREGLPTYETKDIGLIYSKYDDYKFDKSIIITADEQKNYMEVVLKALGQFAPKLADSTLHITHGIVKLAGGVKMSSRKGNFLRAVDVLDYAINENKVQNGTDNEAIALGAVKYAFLKPRIGGDVIYDPKESVSLAGNSGPYLQYAHARACSIISKSEMAMLNKQISEFDENERKLALKLGAYNDALNEAIRDLVPHVICTYLYELAQEFNRFYEKSPIIGNEREDIRLLLVNNYRDILADGLGLLGIIAPEKM